VRRTYLRTQRRAFSDVSLQM